MIFFDVLTLNWYWHKKGLSRSTYWKTVTKAITRLSFSCQQTDGLNLDISYDINTFWVAIFTKKSHTHQGLSRELRNQLATRADLDQIRLWSKKKQKKGLTVIWDAEKDRLNSTSVTTAFQSGVPRTRVKFPRKVFVKDCHQVRQQYRCIALWVSLNWRNLPLCPHFCRIWFFQSKIFGYFFHFLFGDQLNWGNNSSGISAVVYIFSRLVEECAINIWDELNVKKIFWQTSTPRSCKTNHKHVTKYMNPNVQ